MQLPDHLLFLVLAVLAPLRARFSLRRLESMAAEDVPRARRRAYRMILLLQWGIAALTVLWWRLAGRSWEGLGLIPHLNGGAIGVAVGIVIVITILAIQQRRAQQDDHAWDRLRQRMAPLERMLPHTPDELHWFEAVSVTAGVCEELLYRGYLIAYLAHWTGVLPAAFLSSLVFGIAHLYQGTAGILRTGALGLFLASVYLLSRSLYLGMLLHFLADFYSGRVMYQAYRRAPAGPPPSEAA